MLGVRSARAVLVLDRAAFEARGGATQASYVLAVLGDDDLGFLLDVATAERVLELLDELAPESVTWRVDGGAIATSSALH
jgi:hypothetical protein